NTIQQNLFIVQAELAGSADKAISEEKLRAVEKIVGDIEKELPPIKSFFVSGGTEMAALFDIARTFARRAERRVVAVVDAGDPSSAKATEGERKMGEWSMAYLNRLSSILYALARYSNHLAGVIEEPPTYK
ncbi:MAG: ATP:cob(I)alamin adenosyltransferase, partial [bacterium]|nr:ATP:cob(I)alamin adenosyltransferase [bacterium]